MVTKKLILKTNLILLVGIIVLFIISSLWYNHVFKSDILPIMLFALVAIVLVFICVHNSLFALDEEAFLNTYDDIKQLKQELQDKVATVEQHIIIIGKHEVEKLISVPQDIAIQVKQVEVTGVDKIENFVKDIPKELKVEVEKIATDIKEVFEEKAVNNIQPASPATGTA